MKPPKEIKVGGHRYKVVYNDPSIRYSDNLKGYHDPNYKIIKVDPGLPTESDKTEVLIHEVLHAINYVYLANEITEKELDALGQGVFQVLSDLGLEIDWKN